jgi:hypothetical protein
MDAKGRAAATCALITLSSSFAQDGHVELVENEQFEGPTQSEAGELPLECSIAVSPDPARPHPSEGAALAETRPEPHIALDVIA